MPPRILGLHHVTATVDDAQADLDFCIELLGMRLVKKTVNFDNHNVYHFYYGTELGAPGTIWTTFPYKGYGVRVGRKGAGQVVTTVFSVPVGSLEFWRHRLADRECGRERRRGVTLASRRIALQRSQRASVRTDRRPIATGARRGRASSPATRRFAAFIA